MLKRVQHDRKMSGERKNAMRCVNECNTLRERMQCGDFTGAPHSFWGEDIPDFQSRYTAWGDADILQRL